MKNALAHESGALLRIVRSRAEAEKDGGVETRTRLNREARLQWLDREIRAGTFPDAVTIAREMHISLRQAYDDIRRMRNDLNLPITFSHEHGGYRYAEEDVAALPLIHLRDQEAVALRHALTVAEAHLSHAEVEPLRHLIERLAQHVPAIRSTGRESAGSTSRPCIGESETLLAACEFGIRRRQRLRLLYYGAHRDADTDRIVRPYHLHNDNGEWYLLAHCEWRNDIRTFLLSRVREWSPHGDEASFLVPADFDGRALIRQGFHLMHGASPTEVVLRFTSYQARWIRERRNHASQTTEELPDGGLLVRLRVAGTADVRRWVLSFGAEVEVMEPEAPRVEITEEIERTRSRYAKYILESDAGLQK